MDLFHKLLSKLGFKIIRWLGLILWILMLLKRNQRIRQIIWMVSSFFTGLYIFFGIQVVLMALQYGLQMLLAVAFMVIQFVALFWFISRTKAEEVHPGDEKAISWDDYWGNEETVKMVRQWASLLVERKKFTEMGGRTINGLLLIGPPGTGKTMLAKALAGSDGIAFYGMEGSGFRAMFWGVDVMKVIGFFNKGRFLAKLYGACILYLDEIDAIGRSRTGQGGQVTGAMGGLMGGMGSGALNRLLYEMDGIETVPLRDQCENRIRKYFNQPPIDQGRILVIAATNIPEVLDFALTRPGRFDCKVLVDLPDKKSRRQIIEGYLGTIRHADDVDVESLVQDTPGASPAAIMVAITKTAVRLAVFEGHDEVHQRHIEDAFQEQAMGIPNPISELEDEQREQLAIHEAGHAVVQYFLKKKERIVRISIKRRASSLGYMLPARLTDVYTRPLSDFVASIRVALAGHVATEVVLGEPWTGAGSDLQRVKQHLHFLAQHGLFGALPLDMGGGMFGGPTYDPDTGKQIQMYLKKQIDATRDLLIQKHHILDALVLNLLEKEDLSGAEAVEIIEAAEALAGETKSEELVEIEQGLSL